MSNPTFLPSLDEVYRALPIPGSGSPPARRRGAPFRPHRLRTFNVVPCSDSDSDIQAVVSDENGSTPRYSDDTPRNIGTLPSRRTLESSTKRRQRHPASEVINDGIIVPCHPAKCKCSLQKRSSDKCPKGFRHSQTAPFPPQLTVTDSDHNDINSDSNNSIMFLTSSFSDPDATPIPLRRAPIGNSVRPYDWKYHMSSLQNAMTDSGANSTVWCDDITWCRPSVPTCTINKQNNNRKFDWFKIIACAIMIALCNRGIQVLI